jgi:hypothetical protein
MAWLIVPATPALRAAEQTALDLAWVRRGRVTTANADRFQPHVTLAIWDGDPSPATAALPRDVLGRTGIEARLALGIIGANGVYERTLFEA